MRFSLEFYRIFNTDLFEFADEKGSTHDLDALFFAVGDHYNNIW